MKNRDANRVDSVTGIFTGDVRLSHHCTRRFLRAGPADLDTAVPAGSPAGTPTVGQEPYSLHEYKRAILAHTKCIRHGGDSRKFVN